MARTGWIWNEIFGSTPAPQKAAFLPAEPGLPDAPWDLPEITVRVKDLIVESGLVRGLTPLDAFAASNAELSSYHALDYLGRLGARSDVASMEASRLEMARWAAGAAIIAARAVAEGVVTNSYALIRPAGHHARRDRGAGGCIFNNIVLAALEAKNLGARRVAILDWDAHHGNGIQEAFWRDPAVFTISLHQALPIQRAGHGDELGQGDAHGTNLNIPMPPGAGWGAYRYAFEELVVPALQRFRPNFILVASGFDASILDPSSRLALHSEAYRGMTRYLKDVARETAGGRLSLCHEGGYAPAYVPFCCLAVLEELAEFRTGFMDPFLERWGQCVGDQLEPHEKQEIAMCAMNLQSVPVP